MLTLLALFADGGRIRKGTAPDRCRYATIDTETPVFSWSAESSREDDFQSACRVTVRTEDALLWDSGWTERREQSLRYAGKPLPHGIPVTVSAAVRSRYGEESAPFEAEIVSGLLDEGEMRGKWITSSAPTDGRVLYFRRELDLPEMPVHAALYVCGLGYHRASVNGKPVTDAKLEPAHSNYAKTAYYTVHPDVLPLLNAGENALGIEVAEGWRNNTTEMTRGAVGERQIEFFGPSVLWAMLVLRYADGRREAVATDGSWGVKTGPIVRSSIYNGETYDARLCDPAWNLPGEAAGFEPAAECEGPGGTLCPMALEPIVKKAEYPARELTSPQPGLFVADIGQNVAGVVRLSLPAKMEPGQTVTLRFAEELDEDGTLYTAPLRGAKCTDVYVAAGDGRDPACFTPSFTFHGFRYAEISGLEALRKEDLTAELWCTDLKNGSFFSCGSALLNQIQQNVVMTEQDNMHSILTDCPQRDERMAWMNDATVRFEETPYNFDIGRMFPKIVRDIRAEQREEGQFTCCCPYYFGGLPADPVCSSYLIAAYGAWMHTGNLDLLRESFEGLAAWEDYLLSRSRDYIVDYSYYGDWAGPYYACEGAQIDAAKNAETEGILMSTGYSYLNCRLLAEMAEAVGRTADAGKYRDLAGKVKAAFLAKWHDGHGRVGKGSEGAEAFALWLGILPEEVRQAAADLMAKDLVERDYRFTTGNLCTRYLFDMLAKYGHMKEAWTLLTKESYPSYGFMIQNEATTVWERFELKKNPGMNSHNHPMYGAVGYFFYAALAGLTPLEPGWKRFRVAPVLPEGLLSAHAVVDTVRGDISVRWSVRYGKKYLFLQVPFGAEAEVEFCGVGKIFGSGYHVIEAE
ncbi:MAG: family 78 glycoside hydrolase catalytic domain [Clostridia bacterium]|nr:family 78 glycoside hydrolase catalytic domain [Clostridia bacterium]